MYNNIQANDNVTFKTFFFSLPENQVAKIVFNLNLNLPALFSEQNWNSVIQKAVVIWNFYTLSQNVTEKPSGDVSIIRRTTCGRVEALQVLEIVFRDCKGRFSKGARWPLLEKWKLTFVFGANSTANTCVQQSEASGIGWRYVSYFGHACRCHAIRVPIT